MLSKIKHWVYNNVENLPNKVNWCILRLNSDPNRVFGGSFKAHSYTVENKIKDRNIIDIVNYSLQNIPYYQKRYPNLRITSVKQFEDVILPVDKNEVIEFFDEFINPNIDLSKYDLNMTGGTSGRAMQIYLPKDRGGREYATIFSMWKRVGFNFDTRAVLRNHKLKEGEIYRINPITKEVIFDGFNTSTEYYSKIYSVLKKHNIRFLHCYTSNAFEFGKFLVEQELDFSFIEAFLTTSEMVYAHQIAFFKKFLPTVKHYNFYGHTEKMIIGGYQESNDGKYVMEPHYGYTELLRNGDVVNIPGEDGEIVGTSMHNLAMPILRYKTGDWATFSSYKKNENTLTLERIIGRWGSERVYNLSGSYVTTTALNLHSSILMHINGLQYRQEKKGILIVNIIKGIEYSSKTENEILKFWKLVFESDMKVIIEYVGSLEREKNGKFLILKSSL